MDELALPVRNPGQAERIECVAAGGRPGVTLESGSGVPSVSRAFIHGDAVYYVRDSKVYGTFWATPSQVNGPF